MVIGRIQVIVRSCCTSITYYSQTRKARHRNQRREALAREESRDRGQGCTRGTAGTRGCYRWDWWNRRLALIDHSLEMRGACFHSLRSTAISQLGRVFGGIDVTGLYVHLVVCGIDVTGLYVHLVVCAEKAVHVVSMYITIVIVALQQYSVDAFPMYIEYPSIKQQ